MIAGAKGAIDVKARLLNRLLLLRKRGDAVDEKVQLMVQQKINPS